MQVLLLPVRRQQMQTAAAMMVVLPSTLPTILHVLRLNLVLMGEQLGPMPTMSMTTVAALPLVIFPQGLMIYR